MQYQIKTMKKVYTYKSFNSNPNAFGADSLWFDDSGHCREDIIALKEYDGI